MSAKSTRAWKNERASVHTNGKTRTNKHSGGDERHEPGRGSKVWVGGYTRSNGTKVEGHYRAA